MRVGVTGVAVIVLFYFPSFSEGLSLRAVSAPNGGATRDRFPFLFGGTFIEGEQPARPAPRQRVWDFPSFSEGLSLRGQSRSTSSRPTDRISLPFRRDFH